MTEQPTRRGPGRPKGTRASQAQKAAGKDNLKKSSATRAARKQARKAELEKPRWKQLEDGDISVKDLTLDELVRGEVSNNDGSWEGRRHRFDTRMLGRMATEYKRRIRNNLDKLAGVAVEAIEEIINDPEHNQRFQASKMVVEYQIGKVPEVVHVGHESEWDRLQQTGFRIIRGVEAVQVEDLEGDGDVVEAELVEEQP